MSPACSLTLFPTQPFEVEGQKATGLYNGCAFGLAKGGRPSFLPLSPKPSRTGCGNICCLWAGVCGVWGVWGVWGVCGVGVQRTDSRGGGVPKILFPVCGSCSSAPLGVTAILLYCLFLAPLFATLSALSLFGSLVCPYTCSNFVSAVRPKI